MIRKTLNTVNSIRNNTVQLKENLTQSVSAFNALRKSTEWLNLKTELRSTPRHVLSHFRMTKPELSCSHGSMDDELKLSFISNPLDIRHYKETDTLIMDATPDIANFLQSIPHSYDGLETITSMMESEIKGIEEVHKTYRGTLAQIEKQVADRELTVVAGNKLSRKAKVLMREQTKAVQTNWRQVEWTGFHFENLVVNSENPSIGGEGVAFGRTVIDTTIGANRKIPLDVKFHSMYNKNGKDSVDIPLNDQEAIRACIEEYGAYYILVAKGDCVFDEDGSLKEFHNKAKERESENDPNRRTRMMKKSVDIVEFSIYRVGAEDLDKLTTFNQGRQPTGQTRKPKYIMNFGKGGFVPTVKFVTEYGISKGR